MKVSHVTDRKNLLNPLLLFCFFLLPISSGFSAEICSGAQGSIMDQTFVAGTSTTCSASPDITFGPNVILESDSSVTLHAPTITLVAPVSIANGASFKAGYAATRVALAKSIDGVTHVGWVDIDTDTWFDITDYLDATYGATGRDRWISFSNDLRYYLLETERPSVYQGWDGLTWGTLDANGIPSEPMVVDGAPHPQWTCTISVGGTHMAMPLRDDSNRTDIWVVTREGDIWQRSSEINISSASMGNNGEPQFSVTGDKVIWTSSVDSAMFFDENTLDGSQFSSLMDNSLLGTGAKAIRPAYEAGGTIIFEGELGGESCYRWNPAETATAPYIIDSAYSNDNSCYALPDGRIASYWLGRPDGPSGHELRIMSADGTHQAVLQKGTDFWDFLITGGSRK